MSGTQTILNFYRTASRVIQKINVSRNHTRMAMVAAYGLLSGKRRGFLQFTYRLLVPGTQTID
ncbi:hypothetical protein ACIQXW_05560 [Lysinibacillus sp. NPDC097162]|uniref:hypothetical protein n=1 Tax=Lysinibacillus sp. NPDC097162 TaxID=3364140 RepID=UPI0038124001